MKKELALMAVVAGLPMGVQADTLFGVYAGASMWSQAYSGGIEFANQGEIDMENDLGFDEEDATYLYIAIEHMVPMVPNIKLQRTEMSTDANSTLSRNITFEGQVFSAAQDISSTLDLSHTDATFYYEVLDNWVSLDLGMSIRVFDGEVSVVSADGSLQADQSISAPLPMLYGKVQFDLPFSGFSLGAEANYLMVSGNGVSDILLRAAYESPYRVGAELGYRTFTFKLDDIDDLYGELTVEGPYLAVTLHL
ncbi:MAG: TIGR04219 family outer membrane beta-barrel protein [Pseudomonadales bacterium]|nr:TIGR04219 family outer membrane beta-barrel protein [Pseudomonadales bacterium]